jgi:hypothetical protein
MKLALALILLALLITALSPSAGHAESGGGGPARRLVASRTSESPGRLVQELPVAGMRGPAQWSMLTRCRFGA